MKVFWNWIMQNLSHIFSVIGIVLSLYFGVWYVPDWLAENQKEKIINVQRNLEQSIKELVFSDSICSYNEIEILLKAKEIEVGEEYKIDPNNILIKIQESFMQDKFLPLLIRKELIAEIEIIKKQIPKQNNSNANVESSYRDNILSVVSVISTIITVIFGIISYYNQFKKEKEKDEEIANQVNQTANSLSKVESAILYQKKVIEVLRNFPNVKIVDPEEYDRDFDLIFEFKGNTYFVESKFLIKSKVGLGSFEKFVNQSKGLEGVFLFIHNTDLTTMVKNRLIELKEKVFTNSRRQIILLKVSNENEINSELNKILK